MLNYDASFLTNMLIKTGLVTDPQIQEAWEDIGYRTNDAEILLQTLERKGYLTPLQSSKVRKSEFTSSTVAGYRLVYKIASGSFGRVYRAEDPHTGNVVAIKVLRRRHSEDDHIIDLFEREGKLGLQLKHPNIVEVLAVGQDPVSRQYYIVMEFIEGGNLRDILQIRERHATGAPAVAPSQRNSRSAEPGMRGLETAEALRIMEDAVTGIAHAYAQGVTHRDIKLTNVLISTQGQVKLVDFGLAGIFVRKGLELEGQEKVDRTVDYAGLEKATGVKPGDVRSDIYFLGCILYEMLTGRSPLELTRDARARASQQRFSNVTPMSPDEVKGPPQLFQLVQRMMSLDPKVRYQTPAQLLEAVREVRAELETPGSTKVKKATSRTVFVVERDPRLQDALRQKLKEFGFRVLISAEPARAVERFNQTPFELLIMDAGATGEEGRFTFEGIMHQASLRHLECAGILILNEDQQDWAKQMENASDRVVLVRPISMKHVTQAVTSLLPSQPVHDS
jgi:eukaryotic-like serine/threonine-protein kinase